MTRTSGESLIDSKLLLIYWHSRRFRERCLIWRWKHIVLLIHTLAEVDITIVDRIHALLNPTPLSPTLAAQAAATAYSTQLQVLLIVVTKCKTVTGILTMRHYYHNR